MKITNDTKIAIGKHESELNIYNWSGAYPVLDRAGVCIGVVGAYGSEPELLAGEYNGERYDSERDAYVPAIK